MHQWNLNKSNMVAITTDSGANVKSVCALLGCQRLSCFGHNLNLAVEKGLDDMRVKHKVKHALQVCKGVVESFSCSWK